MRIVYSILLAAFCLFTASTASAQDVARMTVEPQVVTIGALYNGTTITATGSIPSDSEAIVRFMGTSCDLHMKERGKVGGVMWMNLDAITFKGAPNVCLVSSAVDFDSLEANGGASIKVLRLSGLKRLHPDRKQRRLARKRFRGISQIETKGRVVPGDVGKH